MDWISLCISGPGGWQIGMGDWSCDYAGHWPECIHTLLTHLRHLGQSVMAASLWTDQIWAKKSNFKTLPIRQGSKSKSTGRVQIWPISLSRNRIASKDETVWTSITMRGISKNLYSGQSSTTYLISRLQMPFQHMVKAHSYGKLWSRYLLECTARWKRTLFLPPRLREATGEDNQIKTEN